MNADELISFCENVIHKSEVMVFGTIDAKGFPQTRTMFNLRNPSKFPSIDALVNPKDDPFYFIVATNTSSYKVEELRQNPHVSVHYCIPELFHSVTVSGIVEIVDSMEFKNALWVQGWEMYYPSGCEDPDYFVFKLNPKLAHGWYGSGKFRFGINSDEIEFEKRYNFMKL